MRIVGGELRGRTLAAPRSDQIRPTTDRTRESVFNILAHKFPDAVAQSRVLDLFAGTGALGIEALSRGARSVVFIDSSAEARGLLRANIETLGLEGRARILRRDATALGKAERGGVFDLVFADPPYGQGLGERALKAALHGGWLADGALVVLEERADCAVEIGGSFICVDRRIFGETAIRFYRCDIGGGGRELTT